MRSDGNPLPEWKLFEADMLDAAGDAAWDAEYRLLKNIEFKDKKSVKHISKNVCKYGRKDTAYDAT
jgi:hypothetical protein